MGLGACMGIEPWLRESADKRSLQGTGLIQICKENDKQHQYEQQVV